MDLSLNHRFWWIFKMPKSHILEKQCCVKQNLLFIYKIVPFFRIICPVRKLQIEIKIFSLKVWFYSDWYCILTQFPSITLHFNSVMRQLKYKTQISLDLKMVLLPCLSLYFCGDTKLLNLVCLCLVPKNLPHARSQLWWMPGSQTK